jgi:hypothetical protein
MNRFWQRTGATVARHPARVLAGAAVTVALLAVGVTRLEFVTDQATLVPPSSEVYRDNARYQEGFGGEPMLVLLSGDIRAMAGGEAHDQLAALEDELRSAGELAAVVGPATALDFALGQLSVGPAMLAEAAERDATAAAEAARAEVAGAGGTATEQEAAATEAADEARAPIDARLASETERLLAAGEQSLDNPAFVDFLLFEADGSIRPGLRDNFLDQDHALLLVRLPGNASIEEIANGEKVVDDIVARYDIPGVETLASGPPELLAEINDYLQGGMATLGALAVGAMVLLLLLVFRVRWPLLPLVVVVVGTVGAFGAAGWAGIPLTLVTISGLPILIGLGVDFAVQMHNRYEEERDDGESPPAAVGRAYSHMAPPLVVAMVAAVVGSLALRRSAVPMIEDFGLLLSVGVVVLVATGIGTAVPVLFRRDRGDRRSPGATGRRRVDAVVRRLTALPARAAVPLLAVGALVAGTGLAVEGGIPIQTDPDRWVDQDGAAATHLRELREGTGFSSELSILVEADDVTDPEVAAWIQRFGAESVRRHEGTLLRATSMAALATGVHATTPGGDDVDQLLSVAPADAARSLVGTDRTEASIVFPIAPVSLNEREAVLDELAASMRCDLAPPPGVRATPAGLAAVAVELVNGLEAGRRTLSLAALLFVFAWLLLAYRSLVRAVLVLAPVLVAVGLTSLAIDRLGIELTPLTTVTGPLVIAVATEFSVLVVARYVEERRRGRDPAGARAGGVVRIGRAFVASGLTLVGGFAVLVLSPMPLLRDFGVVVTLAVLFALVSTLTLLPPLLVWTDQHGWLKAARPSANDATTEATTEATTGAAREAAGVRAVRAEQPRWSGLLRRTRRGPSLPA